MRAGAGLDPGGRVVRLRKAGCHGNMFSAVIPTGTDRTGSSGTELFICIAYNLLAIF